MGEDSSAPSLSQRVPGATKRPKPLMRVAPPVLPPSVLERLRAQAGTAREDTAGPEWRVHSSRPDAKLRTEPGPLAEGPDNAPPLARLHRPERGTPESRAGSEAAHSDAGTPALQAEPGHAPAASRRDGAVRRAQVAAQVLAPRPPVPPWPIGRSPTGRVPPPPGASQEPGAAEVQLPRRTRPRLPAAPETLPPAQSGPITEPIPAVAAPDLTAAAVASVPAGRPRPGIGADPDPGPITEPIPAIGGPPAAAAAGVDAGQPAVQSERAPEPDSPAPPEQAAAARPAHQPAAAAQLRALARRAAAVRQKSASPSAGAQVRPELMLPLFSDSAPETLEDVVTSLRDDITRGRTMQGARLIRWLRSREQ